MKKNTFIVDGKALTWTEEIEQCVSFNEMNMVPITAMLKEVMIRNKIKLTYQNIEEMKYHLVLFAKSNQISLPRASLIQTTREDRKYMPIVEDTYCSHICIRKNKTT
jgi:hypothetical protein